MIITVLDAAPKVLTKTFLLVNGKAVKKDYDKSYEYKYEGHDCNSIDDLHTLLQHISKQSTKCVIRGLLKPSVDATAKVVRQKSTEDAPFVENPNGVSFAMIDFDKIPVPEWLPNELDFYLEYLVSMLPDYFHDVSYVCQWSSQAGMDGWKTLRCHLWFWLEVPRTDTEMRAWANAINSQVGFKLCDPCTFGTVQPNYTANPIFSGVVDPIGSNRIALIRKQRDSVLVPLLDAPKKSNTITTSLGIYKPPPQGLKTRFDEYLERIGGIDGYHAPIIEAIGSWIANTNANSDIGALKACLRTAIMAGATAPTAMDKAGYCNDKYLDDQIKNCHFASKVEAPSRMPVTEIERVRYKMSNGKSIGEQ